jgi:DNA polymerase-1
LWIEIYNITKQRAIEAEKELRDLLANAGKIKVERKQKGVKVIEEIEASEINLNSYQQLIPTLAAFGIKVESTGFDTISNIKHPVAESLIKYRKLTKRLSAFGQSYIDDYVVRDSCNREIVRAGVNQLGAATGRMSYEGPNLQQVPNPAKDPSVDINYRECFTAREGYVLIKADYSQIELRIATELSQEPEFVKAYQEGKDLHTLTASKVFHIPYDQVRKDSKERAIAKNINFAILYGSGWMNLVNKFQISRDEAKRIVQEFHKAYPKLSAKIKELGNDSVINGYSTTILGRKRFFSIPSYGNMDFDEILAAIRREGGNHAVQGSSADMTKLALIGLSKELPRLGGRPVLQIHDELVSEVPKEFAEEASALVKRIMIEAGEVMIKSIKVDVDVHVGESWGG